jgi:hypothetical protein
MAAASTPFLGRCWDPAPIQNVHPRIAEKGRISFHPFTIPANSSEGTHTHSGGYVVFEHPMPLDMFEVDRVGNRKLSVRITQERIDELKQRDLPLHCLFLQMAPRHSAYNPSLTNDYRALFIETDGNPPQVKTFQLQTRDYSIIDNEENEDTFLMAGTKTTLSVTKTVNGLGSLVPKLTQEPFPMWRLSGNSRFSLSINTGDGIDRNEVIYMLKC